ncbi:MAG: hypothetical protein QXX08_05440 [Candidatus Bathyarchaeia archaeon]
MNRENKQQLIFDDFLVEHYKRHILPFLDIKQRERLEKTLDDFNCSKYNFEEEINSTIKFYRQLNSLSSSLRLLGAPKRGIEDLFFTLKKLQEVLFHLPRYRDHLPHQMRVYLLGCYLLSENEEFFIESFSDKYARIIGTVTGKEDDAHVNLIRENLYYGFMCRSQILYDAWSFAGLSHDIGYAVEGISRITRELHNIYRTLQPKVRMKLDVKISPTSILSDQMEAFEDCLELLFHSQASRELKRYVQVLKDQNDHGVWGCFFLTSKDLAGKIKEYALEVKKSISDIRIWDLVSGFSLSPYVETTNILLYILYADAMIAIAFHNNPYLIYLTPFTALLVISDTLQEWNRTGWVMPSTEGVIRRCIYISLSGTPRKRLVDSEIYVYDCSPMEFYEKIRKDFDAAEDRDSPINMNDVKAEFLEGLSFIIRIGPPMGKHQLII